LKPSDRKFVVPAEWDQAAFGSPVAGGAGSPAALVDNAEDHRDEYQSCDWRHIVSLLGDLKYPTQFTIEVNPHASPSPPVYIAGAI
jgi:hypothetical protein